MKKERTKIKIRVLSDLHMDHHRFNYVPLDEDVVVLAGDIDRGFQGVAWALDSIPETTPVIYVPGNHEYDHAEHYDVEQRMREHVSGTNVHLLLNESIIIQDTLFVGGTMWSDFNLFGIGERWFVCQAAKNGVSDFFCQRIWDDAKQHERGWSVEDAVSEFEKFEKLLMQELTTKREHCPDVSARVVVSHFVPHWNSVAQRYRKQAITAYFTSDMSRYMHLCDLWIHGHTHDPYDYMLGDTRVVCNPRGYVAENTRFDPYFTVEI